MPSSWFEPTIPAIKRLQTYALDRLAARICPMYSNSDYKQLVKKYNKQIVIKYELQTFIQETGMLKYFVGFSQNCLLWENIKLG